MAADGEGLYGRTDDMVITLFAFGVMAFFTVLVIVLSLIQTGSTAARSAASRTWTASAAEPEADRSDESRRG